MGNVTAAQLAAVADTSKLSDFDGRTVARATIAVTNAGDGLSQAMAVDPREYHHGQRVYVVLETEVSKVTFNPLTKDDNDLLVRMHTLRAGTATIVDAALVQDVLEVQREAIELAREKAAGIQRLAFEQEEAAKAAAKAAAEPPEPFPAPDPDLPTPPEDGGEVSPEDAKVLEAAFGADAQEARKAAKAAGAAKPARKRGG